MDLLHIFSAGTHRDGQGRERTYTESDLEAIASAYDPALHQAPVVIGHPKDDAPAYGWVRRLVVKGQRLYADLEQVSDEFAEWVRAGHYKMRSASFYLPEGSPVPGTMYLRHVGFLGAMPPAVKGLEPFQFGDGRAYVEFADAGQVGRGDFASPSIVARMARGLREFFIAQFGLEKAEQALPAWVAEGLEFEAAPGTSSDAIAFVEKNDPIMDARELAAEKAALEQQKAALEQQKAALEQQQKAELAKQRRQAHADFVEGLVKDNSRVLPGDAAVIVGALVQLDAAGVETVEFGEGDAKQTKPLAEAMRAWLARLPQNVEYAEKARAAAGTDDAVDAKDAKALARAATEYVEEQRAKGVTVRYSDAVNHVEKTRAT